MMKKKILTLFLIPAMLLIGTANCFGKFSLIRKMHAFNDGINIGGKWVSKFIKTLIMWVSLFFAQWWMFAIDMLILNVIEFWTDSNPLGLNEYDKDGRFVRELAEGDSKVRLEYTGFGQRLNVSLSEKDKLSSFVVLRNQPGEIFEEREGRLIPINVESQKIGNKAVLRMVKNGKLESAKVVDYEKISEIESKLSVY